MSVKNFKFVSPGVFINEIDNSFIPRTAPEIGPVVVGRARRGLAMTPVKVESYSKFVEMFGDTVAGGGNSDIYREGNYTSPMYGGYAAKAFLRSNVAPITYVRLLGQQTDAGRTAGGAAAAGWATTNAGPTAAMGTTGGAWGLWVFPSASAAQTSGGGAARGIISGAAATASLAAIIYTQQGVPLLSGSLYGTGSGIGSDPGAEGTAGVQGINTLIKADSTTGLFTLIYSASGVSKKIKFDLNDSSENYIRKKLNTNPQLATSGDFYPSATEVNYFLGETFDQDLLDKSLATNKNVVGMITALGYNTLTDSKTKTSVDTDNTPAQMKQVASTEGRTSWIIGQDLGAAEDYYGPGKQKLFRLVGRGHGEWLMDNVKISISNVRQSNNSTSDYGTFSVILRDMNDSDNDVVIIERYDECTLNPASPNFVARKIGDTYVKWDAKEKRLRRYGEYDNNSKFVYIQMNADVEAGAIDAVTLPFGYFGPPKLLDVSGATCRRLGLNTGPGGTYGHGTSDSVNSVSGTYVTFAGSGTLGDGAAGYDNPGFSVPNTGSWRQGGAAFDHGGGRSPRHGMCIGSGALDYFALKMEFPKTRLRHSASAGGLTDPRNAYFGMQTSRGTDSTISTPGIGEMHRMWSKNWPDDPTAAATAAQIGDRGYNGWGYVFSLDEIISGSTGVYYYASGSRTREQSYTTGSWKAILDAGYNKFTVPIWGAFDGWDITKPDPAYNKGMTPGSSTELNDYIFHTWARAMDTVADPEAVDMNMLCAPGLTNNQLTEKAMDICAARGDALALIDLANVYLPTHEIYKANKADRLASTPNQAAISLRDRKIDTSYGATFYPWVQTRDESSGKLLWIPPTVAMMGVLASSQKKSQLWFAPAGFNRGGLTEGAAGIPILNVTQRLTSKERDTLYEARINPIASFPSTGIVVFGQKTLQERQSALDRINVRRLVIYLKKQISIISSKILFEQNVQATWNRFRSLVEPFLANVKVTFGITDYKLILDETTTTPDLIDQNIMYAKIMVKPARAIEFIAIDFVIASTGASFDD
jgi:hypothetical protein